MIARAVFFDIDNTLYSYDAAHSHAWRAVQDYAAKAFSIAPERLNELHDAAFRLQKARAGMNSAAIHNRLIRYQLMLEALGLPIAPAPEMANRYWATFMDAVEPFPGVSEAFDRIRSMGIAIGIGTNMTADYQYEKLIRLGLLRHVEYMVTSEEAGAEKPDPRLFNLCAEKAGCATGNCVFAGDSLKGDVLGALNAGMRAVWFNPEPGPAESPPGACRLRSFDSLPDLLASL